MVFDEAEYRYRNGYSAPVAARVVGRALEQLGINERAVTPAEIVAAAKPPTAVLHACFEWNNKVAADLHRQDQARRLVRSIEIVRPAAADQPIRREIAFVSVGTSGGGGKPGYISATVAMSQEDMRAHVIAAALAQLRGWQIRYRHLTELAPVVAAIDAIDVGIPA